jgi:hypothetical protein
VFLGTMHHIEFNIENRGDIIVPFDIIAPFNDRYTIQFEPATGEVQVNSKVKIRCAFRPSVIGDVDEHFKIKIQGNPEDLIFNIRGKTLGPQFKFGSKSIEFGNISNGFASEYILTIQNTSPIPMNLNLRSDHDDFEAKPDSATISPTSSLKVKIICRPKGLGPISGRLLLDIDHVGKEVASLAMNAISNVPEVP